jgi:hypothetical protein
VTYTPSNVVRRLFSLHDSWYTFAVTGSLDTAGEIQLHFRLASSLGSRHSHVGTISEFVGSVCMSMTRRDHIGSC